MRWNLRHIGYLLGSRLEIHMETGTFVNVKICPWIINIYCPIIKSVLNFWLEPISWAPIFPAYLRLVCLCVATLPVQRYASILWFPPIHWDKLCMCVCVPKQQTLMPLRCSDSALRRFISIIQDLINQQRSWIDRLSSRLYSLNLGG